MTKWKTYFAFGGVAFSALVGGLAYVSAIVSPLLTEFTHGFVARPFVYRWLPNVTLGLLSAVTRRVNLNMPPPFDFPVMQAIAVQSVVCLFVFGLSVYYLSRRWSDSWVGVGVAAASPIVVLVLYARSPHPYDLPILALFTLGLALLAHERMWAFMAVFVLACATKETAIFLAFAYAATVPSSPKFILAMSGVWGVGRAITVALFQNLPGTEIEFHLLDQLLSLTWPGIAAVYITMLVVMLLVVFKLGDKPEFLKRAAIIVLIFFVLYLVDGVPLELRVFGEVFPIVYLLALWPVVKGVGT